MIKHIEAIRKVDGLINALLVIIPESNLGWEAQRTEEDLRRNKIKNVVFIKEDGQSNRAGFRMDENLKNAMALATKDKLERGKIVFHKNFMCVDPDSTAASLKDNIVRQFRNYSRKLVLPNDINKQPKVFWGGKSGYGTYREQFLL